MGRLEFKGRGRECGEEGCVCLILLMLKRERPETAPNRLIETADILKSGPTGYRKNKSDGVRTYV